MASFGAVALSEETDPDDVEGRGGAGISSSDLRENSLVIYPWGAEIVTFAWAALHYPSVSSSSSALNYDLLHEAVYLVRYFLRLLSWFWHFRGFDTTKGIFEWRGTEPSSGLSSSASQGPGWPSQK